MEGRIKLWSSFVIKILCNICKGKISTFVVLEGAKDLVEIIISLVSRYHCYPLKCGRISLSRGMAIII